MSTLPRLFLCIVLLPFALPAQDGLTKEGKQAASTLKRAGWSGGVPLSAIAFTVRLAPVCTPAMRNAMAHLTDLPAPEQEAFATWAKIEFRKPGWFFKAKVQKGKYEIGLSLAHGQPMLTLKKDGKKVGQNPFWFEGEIQAHPKVDIRQSGGASVLTIRFDNIALPYRFIPDEANAALQRPLKVYGKGRVRIFSDLGCHRQLRDLASWLEKAMAGSESFYETHPGKHSYEICLFATRKGYQDADGLWTGGNRARNWAFTSSQSQISYVWYHPHTAPQAFEDQDLPLRIKMLCLHELQHALSYKSRRSLLDASPRWFSEALAERGVHAGMAAIDKKLAQQMHQRHVDRLAYARADTSAPVYQDVLNWQPGKQLSELYSAAYLFSYRGALNKPDVLQALLDRVDEAGFPHEALFVLRDNGFDAAAYAKSLPTGKPKLPLRIYGDYDVAGKNLRLVSSKGSQGRILLPQRAGKDRVQVKGSFSWQALGETQVDLYLAYRRGLHSAEFLKLALMPGRVVLFSYRSGTWLRVAIKDFDENLAVGSAKERAWHPFYLELDAKTRKLELVIDENRKASMALPGSLDLAGTRVGLGVYDGIAWFKSVVVR